MRRQGMWQVWGTGEMYTRFWWKNLREGDHLEGLNTRWEDNIKKGSLSSRMGRQRLDSFNPGYGQVEGTCKCRNTPSDPITYFRNSYLADSLLRSFSGRTLLHVVNLG
jgi:hypothetical protein